MTPHVPSRAGAAGPRRRRCAAIAQLLLLVNGYVCAVAGLAHWPYLIAATLLWGVAQSIYWVWR